MSQYAPGTYAYRVDKKSRDAVKEARNNEMRQKSITEVEEELAEFRKNNPGAIKVQGNALTTAFFKMMGGVPLRDAFGMPKGY